ncbi:AP-4 complex subunit epsilon isoform X2 [Raphanus sativus]|uniref:AP-4 complex subunit epsilon n=1 Tax=Raphanus sativus TaxID=3726 RepID=A0A6J0N3I3_RAPSA|nr:AP-4 complex subunit epsilon isoform X2 [Raphanus sativus]
MPSQAVLEELNLKELIIGSELSSPNAHGGNVAWSLIRRRKPNNNPNRKMEQLKTIGRELAMGSQGGFGQSKEFLDLVKSIGESRSKAEEDRIVLTEIDTLKRKLLEPDIPKRKLKEHIIRLVYIEMLGHDASFGYIHAVKMTHDDSLLLKRTGYLAVTLFLDEDHDLIILIVNTIQKDLRSDNYLVVCAALNAVCRLINEETIPAVLPQVVDLLSHGKEAVRKKAIMALHRFHRKSPSSVSHLVSNFRRKLCDNDPGVMGATLCPLFDLISEDVNSYKDLVSSFVSILKQVTERRLPKSYDYHQMPAPFIQIKLLKIMALLSSGDKSASEMMYMVLGDLFRKCDSSTNIGNAILYECIRCISCIVPSPQLLESAADAISKFLKSDSHNLKYMGIDGLGRLIKISSDIAEQHQLAVIDCLEDPDDTLKRKTFELLYKMTKSSNVEVIVDRMIDYMISINDNHYKTEIASRCVELAEQFAPSNQWFIQIMNKVFEHAGDLVNIKVAHNLMRLIAEGFGEDDDDADNKLRLSAVESYLQIISEPKLPSLFLQVISWVLGEYGTADGKYSASYISGKLCDVADAYSSDETVKGYAVSALMKIYAFEIASGRKVDVLPECQTLIEELLASHSTDLQQRAYELQALLALDARAVESILPLDASCEDIEVDKDLSFLNGYIQQAIESGAQPYISERERSGMFETTDYHSQDHHEVTSHALRFEAYELPKPSVPSQASTTALVPVPEPSYYSEPHQPISTSSSVSERESSEIKLRLDGVKQKWGRPSYQSSTSASSSTPPQAANGTSTHSDGGVASSSSSRPRSSYEPKKPEINPEKQRLAASLFGGSSTSRSDRKSSSGGHKPAKGTANRAATVPKENPTPVPDLLDFDEPTATSGVAATDPFKELEGLMESSSQDGGGSTDVMGLYGAPVKTTTSVDSLLSELSDSSRGTYHQSQTTKGPNSKEALEKDALVRQMGVNPTSQNPTLFKDLLG